MINKDKFFEKLGITPGEWEWYDNTHSGYSVVTGGKPDHTYPIMVMKTEHGPIKDKQLIVSVPGLFMALLMGLPEFGDVGVDCPWCGNDLRKKYTCKSCEIDHMGGGCFHDGEHEKDCMAIKIIESATGRTWGEIKNIVEECKE